MQELCTDVVERVSQRPGAGSSALAARAFDARRQAIPGVIRKARFVGELAQRDVWVMLGVAVLGVYFMASKRRMSRLEGAVCVALYVGYIGFIFAV